MKNLQFVIFFLVFNYCTAQNLVPNFSFEQYDTCVNGYGQIYLAVPWFQPNICCGPGGSSDFFAKCTNNPNIGVPDNSTGFQNAKNGVAYAGIGVSFYGFNDGREYLEARLKSPLIGGKKYCVHFYVSKADKAFDGIDVIGAYFSVDTLLYNDVTFFYLPYQPQVVNAPNNIITDTVNWVLISGEFIANGSEKFITIGNFFPDSLTNHDTTAGAAYYYIDDVSVMLCDDTCKETPPVAKFNYSDTGLTAKFNNLSTATSNNWLWYFGDGTSDTLQNPVHIYDSAGTFTVTLIACDSNCCNTFEGQVVVSEVGEGELGVGKNSEVQIFPNPASESVTIFSNCDDELIITDITGRKIRDYKKFLNNLTLPMDGFDLGIYFFYFYCDGVPFTVKKIVHSNIK